MPQLVVEALRDQRLKTARLRQQAGSAWHENDLVFPTQRGDIFKAYYIRREFKKVTVAAGLGEDWWPYTTRHTFVSILDDQGIPLERIAEMVGHSGTRTTEQTYKHVITPALRTGATVMDSIFADLEVRGLTATGRTPTPPENDMTLLAEIFRAAPSPRTVTV